MALLTLAILTINIIPVNAIAGGGGGDIKIILPIDEIEGLIQDLEDAGSRIVGEAGVQLRQSIAEMASQMRDCIDQLKGAAIEVINAAAAQIRSLLNNLIKQARNLLREVNQMIQDNIKCISQALAERIAQVKDSIVDIIQQVSAAVRDAVNLIYLRAISVIDRGTYNITVMVDSTINIIAKVIILIFIFILLFWLIRALWKGAFPKVAALKYGLPSLAVIIIALGVFLLLSPVTLGKIIGYEVQIPKSDNACENGDNFYSQFMNLKNTEADSLLLKNTGDSALHYLSICAYTSMSTDFIRGIQNKIGDIAAVLYPPPDPPSSTPVVSDCESSTGSRSINPSWLSKYDLLKVNKLQRLVGSNVLRESAVPLIKHDTTQYFMKLRVIPNVRPEAIIMQPVRVFRDSM